jgi:hypothetical protein
LNDFFTENQIKLNEIIAGNFEELVCAFGVVGKIFIW